MTLEKIKEELAKRSAPTQEISALEMSKTPLPPDNREELRAELDLAQRRVGQEPRQVVRRSEWLEALDGALTAVQRLRLASVEKGISKHRDVERIYDALIYLRTQEGSASNDQGQPR